MSLFRKTLALLLPLAGLFGCGGPAETVRPSRQDAAEAIFASGQVRHADEYWVTANVEGFVRERSRREGDTIPAGAPLFRLSGEVPALQAANALASYEQALRNADASSPRLEQLEAQLAQARKALALDARNLERYAALAKTHAVSQLDYDKAQLQVAASQSQVEVLEKSLADLKSTLDFSAQTAHIQLDIQKELERDYTVKAMAPGVLLEVSKQAGELARRGELLARIGAGPLLARLYVAEEDINGVRVGQEVFLHLNTEPERAFRASVSRIYPAFDEREQSFVVEAAFAEAPAQLWPGTQVQANIVAARRPQALTLPRACLLPGDRVRLAGGEEVALSIGVRTQEWVEVLSGLDEGAEVLVSN